MEEDSLYHQENKFTPKELKNCPECNKPRISFEWCKECEANSMKENFYYWTSGNKQNFQRNFSKGIIIFFLLDK
jgi:hypothetical protein